MSEVPERQEKINPEQINDPVCVPAESEADMISHAALIIAGILPDDLDQSDAILAMAGKIRRVMTESRTKPH